jgi:HrpA-like RNA helicase
VENAKKAFEATVSKKGVQNQKLIAFTLYGKQPPEEQQKVFEKNAMRKVIFATDVAETSVTIDGVR